jgi:hypothetical protein
MTESLANLNGKLRAVHGEANVDGSFLVRTLEAVTRDVTKYVGQGNLLVFQELAPLYAAWLQTFKTVPAARDTREIDGFVANWLKPGSIADGGQDFLIKAFRAYYDAMLEKDPIVKAQQMFLANALVGYHEQTRLQDPIVGSLDAPLVDVFLDNAKACVRYIPLVHGALENIIEELLRPVAERVEEEWQRECTRWLMKLTIPRVVLDLGKDVPWLSAQQMFPDQLRMATFEPLVEILTKLDRTPNTVDGSGAKDWGDLGDRMNFVVDFFRTCQQDPSLYQQPFADDQVTVIQQGGMPGGAL